MSEPNQPAGVFQRNNNIAALDGVRALAVALVMAVHYHEKFGGGWIGVQLFFVLSGFLITRILIDAKEAAAGIGGFLQVFWVRRALRIFPLYVLFLLIGELAWWFWSTPVTWSSARIWLWTYSLNFGHMFQRVPISDVYSHFWSLAVEEQFYLVWPVIIWFCSRRALQWLIVILLAGMPVMRWLLIELNILSTYQLYFFTPTLFDAFAAGAALVVFDWGVIVHARRAMWIAIAVMIGAGVAANLTEGLHFSLWSMGYPYFMPHAVQFAWGYTLLNLCAALVLLACLRDEANVFAHPLLVNIGKISYGIYIIHRPVYRIVVAIQPILLAHMPSVMVNIVSVAIFAGGSVALASISYRFFESPLLRLKRYFVYNPEAKGVAR